jgi:hypothetical protein
MRSLIPVVLAALLGAVVASTFAEAGEAATAGQAVCVDASVKSSEKFMNESLAAGRDRFVSVGARFCSW